MRPSHEERIERRIEEIRTEVRMLNNALTKENITKIKELEREHDWLKRKWKLN